MVLEGTVTNVTNFGAFVDIGVHQDGLVHISMLASRFVKDPHEVVKAGAIVKVRVLEIDEKRNRIALTMRLEDPAPRARDTTPHGPGRRDGATHKPSSSAARTPQSQQRPQPQPQGSGAMAEALAKALERRR